MNKKQYIAPTLTVVSFVVEKGFAESGIGLGFGQPGQETPEGYNEQAQENWQDDGDLFGTW